MKAVVTKEARQGNFLLQRAKSLLCASVAIVYLFSAFTNLPHTDDLLSIISLACLAICLPFIKKSARVVAIVLFLVGAGILVANGASLATWQAGMIVNANLITLLLLVPIFGLPLKHGSYYGVLDALVTRYMNSWHHIYWAPALLTHFFGALMNMGAIPIVYQLIVRGRLPKVFNTVPASILKGFSSSIYWSPNMVSVGVVTYYLGLSWAEFARYGVSLSVISLLVGWLVHVFFHQKNNTAPENSFPSVDIDVKKLNELIIFCAAFIGVIIFIATQTNIPVLDAAPLLALIYPVFWLGMLGRVQAIPKAYRDYGDNVLPGFISEIIIFIGAGFAATALLSSDIGDRVSLFISTVGFPNECFLCLGILASILFLAVLGVIPLVTVMAYCASLNPATIGLTPIELALVLVGGWATSVIISPFTGVTLIMSGLAQKTSFEITFANWPFAGLMVLFIAAVPLLI